MQNDSQRAFDRVQKNQLYILAEGKCQICNGALADGWEADHKIAWADGGPTVIENSKALCISCNRKKAKKYMYQDEIVLREFQDEMVRKSIANYEDPVRENKLVALPFCGSGKTLGALAVANEFYRKGIIDCVVYLTPRSNLCRQVEKEWMSEWEPKFSDPKMGKITRRLNKNPILLSGHFGYTTTYQSVTADDRTSNLRNHLNAISNRKFILICDESQMLGDKKNDKDATITTQSTQILANKAEFILLMTATEFRSDNRRLFLGDYSNPEDDPQEKGKIYLLADVNSSYRTCLARGYLKPIDAKLVSGEAHWRSLDTGEVDHLVIDEIEKELYKVLIHHNIFGPIVDIVVNRVKEAQLTDSRYCGLIAAMNQKHAKAIKKYLDENHKSVKCLIAISEDGGIAHTNLEEYKRGGYDIIISVQMVYVGYDHPPITVIGILTHYRFSGFLDQLIGRGLRIRKDRPRDEQVCFIATPNDPLMVEYIEKLREDSLRGMLERDGGGGGGGTQIFGITEKAIVTGESGKGINADGDLDQVEMPLVEGAMAKFAITGSRTGQAELIRSAGGDIRNIGNDKNGNSPSSTPSLDNIYIPEEDKITIEKGIISEYVGMNARVVLQIQGMTIDKDTIADAIVLERKRTNRHFKIMGIKDVGNDLGKLKEMSSFVFARNMELKKERDNNV